jgi:trigger factor
MQVTETLSEGLKRELKVVVPAAELDASLMRKLGELKERVRIKGFRPGKVPIDHLKRVYGRGVMAEIVQEKVAETSRQALDERKERPAIQPKIALTEDEKEIADLMAGNHDLAYSLAFEVMPAIEVGDLSKIALVKEIAVLSDEEVDAAVGRIAAENRPYSLRDKAAKAEDGDRLTIDYVGTIDGEPFEGGKDENGQIVLGSGQFIPGFEEGLKGAEAGDKRIVKIAFPEDYPAQHLAGKEAEFAVTVKEVAAPGAVEIDDAFAQQLGIESLDKLKNAIRDQMSGDLAAASRAKLKRALLDELDRLHSFELPPTLVEQEFEAIWRQTAKEMEQAGRSFADEGSSEEEAREEYERIAERRVRLGLVLAEIGERNDIKVTDEEVQRALVEQARRFPGQERAVVEYYQNNPQALAQMRAPIFEDKIIDYILELAAVAEKTVSREELLHVHDDDHDHDHDDGGKADKKAAAKKPAAKKDAAKKTAAKKTAKPKKAAKAEE